MHRVLHADKSRGHLVVRARRDSQRLKVAALCEGGFPVESRKMVCQLIRLNSLSVHSPEIPSRRLARRDSNHQPTG